MKRTIPLLLIATLASSLPPTADAGCIERDPTFSTDAQRVCSPSIPVSLVNQPPWAATNMVGVTRNTDTTFAWTGGDPDGDMVQYQFNMYTGIYRQPCGWTFVPECPIGTNPGAYLEWWVLTKDPLGAMSSSEYKIYRA